ncbi:MAG: glycosyltransferase family 4 protein [Acidimicrobiales bacterium]
MRTNVKETMTVLGVTPTGVLSGAERVLIRHALAGPSFGDTWAIACPDGPAADRIESDGIRRVRVPELKLGGGPRPLAAAWLALNNLRALRPLWREARRADVIIANSVLCLPVLKLLRALGVETPVAWLVHDVITRPDLERMAKWSASVVDRSIPVSEASAELSRAMGIPTTVVRNGINPRTEEAEPTDDDPVIGLNAVLTHWKGQHVLLEAMALVDPPARAELLGGTLPKDGPYEAQLRERAAQPDLAGRVSFLGHTEDTDSVMQKWTIAVSASVEPEAGPLSVLEAMSLGLPVIVTNHGGAPEIALDTGLIVEPGDPAALAEAITTLLANSSRRHTLGQAGRKLVADLLRRDQLESDFRVTVHAELVKREQ